LEVTKGTVVGRSFKPPVVLEMAEDAEQAFNTETRS